MSSPVDDVVHKTVDFFSESSGARVSADKGGSYRNRASRRRLLQIGGIGVLGLGLPELLQAGASSAGQRSRRGSERSCILIFQTGGASQLDTWDMKPDAPAEIRGPYKPIATRVPGIRIGELMPRLAQLADRYCLVRSLTHANSVHDFAQACMNNGQSRVSLDAPPYGSVMARLRPSAAYVPSYVWLQKIFVSRPEFEAIHLGGGFLGPRYSPLMIGRTTLEEPSAPGFRVTAFDPPAEISPQRLRERGGLLQRLDLSDTVVAPSPAGTAYRGHLERALDLVTRPEARAAFDLEREPVAVRDRYGRHALGQNLLMARRLIEAGVRLVGVSAWTGYARGDKLTTNNHNWDMHGAVGIGIFDNGWNGLGLVLPRADEAVSALLEDLDQRGLLENTLVVVVGEFGRTPEIQVHETGGVIGRDHWPHCFTGLFAGAGVRGGMIYGASDKRAAYVKDHPVSPEDFAATIYHALGVPPETRLSPDGFTRPASSGKPLLDLFG